MKINNAHFHQTTQIEKEVTKDYLIANLILKLICWFGYILARIYSITMSPYLISENITPHMHNL